jgi:anti-sigma factor RsiW
MNDHLSPEMLQLLADGELPEDQAVAARVHMTVCPSCASAAQKIQRFDRALRRLPFNRTQPRFTQDVLTQLRILPRAPLAFRILEHAGSAFGVVLVLSVLLVVYVSATSPGRGGELVPEGVAGTVLQTVKSALDQGLAGFTGWLAHALPQVFGHGAIGISLMLLLMVPAIALIDRLWGRKRVIGG